MSGRSILTSTDFYQPFPKPEDVFAEDVERHGQYLLPVGILSLDQVNAAFSGKLPLIVPIEPVGGFGFLGGKSTAYHNHLCRPDWIGYQLVGDKCRLAGDFRFFHREFYAAHPPADPSQQREFQEIDAHYQRVKDVFSKTRERFAQEGELGNNRALVCDLGGVSYHANWSNVGNLPLSRYPDKMEDMGEIYDCDRVLPQTDDGRDFFYICAIEMWNYLGNSNGMLLVFYDPQKQLSLSVIDWT